VVKYSILILEVKSLQKLMPILFYFDKLPSPYLSLSSFHISKEKLQLNFKDLFSYKVHSINLELFLGSWGSKL
jgi:hypothetical protein